ncbi:MAG TPA: VTT domain-containing protein [Myxococcales bacterium]|jgi:membrane protein DedA with SNARE-associated domain|nr:VTT domain-containing protein [Myxococcales bacterium]
MAGFLLRNGYVLLFAASLFEQLGAPLPSSPLLLGAGALARAGDMALPQILALSVIASMLGHSLWFYAGRRRGASVLRLLCRISIEPDSCVRRTENLFSRHGGRALVAAPWVPGLAVIAPPLAGMSGMSWRRFLALDALGALLWASIFALLGFLFGPQIAMAVNAAIRLGAWFALAGGIALGLWLGWKFAQRHWLLRTLAIPRIEPDALAARVDSGTAPLIVDLRHELDLESAPTSLPGAVVVGVEELVEWAEQIPRDREIILTCD